MTPGLILIITGLLLPLVPRGAGLRQAVLLLAPVLTLLAVWHVPEGVPPVKLAGFDLQLVQQHAFTLIFATIFAIAAFAGALFGLRHAKTTELAAAYVYAGGAIGVTFAGDFITLFIFWELMAIGSTVVVWCGGQAGTRGAGLRYGYMHFVGGVVLLLGIAAHVTAHGDAELTQFTVAFSEVTALFSGEGMTLAQLASWLILLGVLVNAAAPPFSAWLPDAYPESSPFGAVFLSAFTTKTAVFVLLTLFVGNALLIAVGLFMVFYGIIYAMLENDMRRILSYSIVNQVGFMVVGVGIGTTEAQYGAAAHAFCHIIYKALLLMSAGAVLYQTGRRKCSTLGGLYHSMPLTTVCGIIGALAISAFPLTSGFVSKSLISSAAAYEGLVWVWFFLAAASAGVFLHAGIKFPWFVFFQKDSGLRPKDPPFSLKAGMVLLAAGCLLPGIFPQYLYLLLPGAVEYVPYTKEHVITQAQLLLFSGLAFFVLLPWLKRTETITLDMDWLYRVFLRNALLLLNMLVQHIAAFIPRVWAGFFAWIMQGVQTWCGVRGVFAGNLGVGATALITTTLLGAFLILYYLG